MPVDDIRSCASGGSIAAGRHIGKAGDIVIAGDSLTDWTPGSSWGLPLAGSPCRLIYNAGVASNTLDDLWARWSTDVLAKNPGIVMLRIGTNSLSLAAAAFRSKYQLFMDSLIANGIFGIILAIPPKGSYGATILAHNAWLAVQCAGNPSRLRYVEDSTALGDGSYNYLPAYFSDDTHMNGKGMHAQGVAMAPTLQSSLTRRSPLIIDGADTYAQNAGSNQYISNPLMAGAGSSPTGWAHSVGGAGTSASPSIVAADAGDENQTPWFRTTIASTGGNDHYINIYTNLAHPALAADTTVVRLDMIAHVRLNGLVGAAIKHFYIECIAGANRVAPTSTITMPSDETLSHTLVMRSSLPRSKNGIAAHLANTIRFNFTAVARAAYGGTVGSIDIRCVSVRAQGD